MRQVFVVLHALATCMVGVASVSVLRHSGQLPLGITLGVLVGGLATVILLGLRFEAWRRFGSRWFLVAADVTAAVFAGYGLLPLVLLDGAETVVLIMAIAAACALVAAVSRPPVDLREPFPLRRLSFGLMVLIGVATVISNFGIIG